METHQQPPQYHYQYQPTIDSTPVAASASASLSYDPSQVQPYDQSSYYAYHNHHYTQPQQQQQQPDYSSYYYPDYSSSYQTHHSNTEPHSIHPPGVPIPAETQPTHLQNSYYPHGVVAHQPPPPQGYMPSGHSAYRGGGNHAGRSMRGGGRGTFGRHGRGRGGGRGKHVPHQISGSSAPTTANAETAQSGKPQMAWCELCRVDCNTFDILEQHRNGKKHKRNLKVYEELQNLSRQMTAQNPQMPLSQSKPENVTSESTPVENKGDGAAEKDVANKAEPSSGAIPSEDPIRKDHFAGRGGLKRKIRGGRGGKWLRGYDGSRRTVEPPKPKMVHLICELCNVKCESQVVFESHIAGKKHLTNVKRYEGHKEAFGENIQALYPTIPNLPSTSIIPQTNQQGPQDAQALASMMLNQQSLQDPQAAHAALAQLLNQHGIHDAQTLLTQLVPYLLTQFQVPGSVVPVPVAGLGVGGTQNSQSQGPEISTGAESQSVITENKTEQQNVTTNMVSQAGTNTGDEPVPPENDNVGS